MRASRVAPTSLSLYRPARRARRTRCHRRRGTAGVLRTVQITRGETDEGLDVLAPIVVEGVLRVIRHPARGEFPAVVELQVRKARRVS